MSKRITYHKCDICGTTFRTEKECNEHYNKCLEDKYRVLIDRYFICTKDTETHFIHTTGMQTFGECVYIEYMVGKFWMNKCYSIGMNAESARAVETYVTNCCLEVTESEFKERFNWKMDRKRDQYLNHLIEGKE